MILKELNTTIYAFRIIIILSLFPTNKNIKTLKSVN
jgi:hypothetical protein